MIITAKVPKDVSAIKKKLIFNLTKRQIICFALAGVVGFGVYNFLKKYMATDMAALLMVACIMPFLFVGIYEKDGYPAERILYFMVQRVFLLPGIRPYKATNFYDRKQKENKTEKMKKTKGGNKKVGKRAKEKAGG